MGTFSDFRFLRLRHEVSVTAIGRDGWEPLAKGGAFSFYYSDIHLLLNWQNDGAELSAVNIAHNGQDAQVRQASGYWRQSGLTYSKRSQKGFSARALPAECIIAGKGPAILSQSNVSLEYLLGWINSRFIRWIIEIQANDHEYNTGIVKKIPWVEGTSSCNELVKLTKATVRKVQSACGINDTNSCFIPIFNVDSLKESLEQWHRINEHAELTLMNVMADWDKFIDQLYGVDSSGLQLDDQDEDSASKEDDDEQEEDTLIVKSESAGGAIGIMVGFVFGRWDVRITLDSSFAPKLPDPFDPLPICPPGMLVGPDGLPAESNGIGSEEVLRSRLDANTLLPEGAAAQNLTITDAEYPLRISWNGILVDDPGFEREQLHEDDLVLRCREVFEILWKDKAHDIEQEACEILKIAQLRDYFRKSFFTDHIKRYSKSRRKAPIYWQLSTPSASYSIWLYYHRFTKDTFYRVMNEYVVPKLQFEERELNKIRQQYGINPTAGQRKELASREAFVAELSSFKEDVARIAPLWNPDLNDGVIINFAPLWRLVPQNKAWQKECMQVWDKLADGEYDWAHLAMHLWPERVVPKCAKDRSLAIAHGLDEVFWQEDEKGKAKPTPVSGETVKALVQERTSPTVKAALEDLLKAPAPATMAKKKRKKKA
jgi:hypothetical protein